MTRARQLALVETRTGRVILHLAALIRDHRFSRHVAGIVREIRGQ